MLARRVEVLKKKLQDMEKVHRERLSAGGEKWEMVNLGAVCSITYLYILLASSGETDRESAGDVRENTELEAQG